MPSAPDPLSEALGELGARVGQDCMPDPNGVVTFTADHLQLSIETKPTDDHAYFHVPVGRLAEMPRGALRTALEYNLFQQPLTGSWLALDRETDELVLCLAVPKAGLDADTLATVLDGLAEAAARVAGSLAPGANAAVETDSLNDLIRI